MNTTETATRTVVGFFSDFTAAQRAIDELETRGIHRENVSIVAPSQRGRNLEEKGEYAPEAREGDPRLHETSGGGAGTGAAIGGGLGLIAGLAALAIPGFGPVLAAGPILTALAAAGAGAAVGGVIGGLTDMGVPDTDAEYYAEGVRRGGIVVTVRTTADKVATVEDVLSEAGARDVNEEAETWRQAGWNAPAVPFYHQEKTATSPATSGSTANDWRTTQTSDESVTRRGVRVYGGPALPRTGVGSAASNVDYEDDFRSHFNTVYGTRGSAYDRYSPAYRFGANYANDAQYRGQDWSAVESDARRDWESRGHGTWEDFKDAIRHGWDKVRGRA